MGVCLPLLHCRRIVYQPSHLGSPGSHWCNSEIEIKWNIIQRLNCICSGCSLEGMTLKLKLQYFGHLMRRVDSLEKTDAGRDRGQEEKGTTEDEMDGWHH